MYVSNHILVWGCRKINDKFTVLTFIFWRNPNLEYSSVKVPHSGGIPVWSYGDGWLLLTTATAKR
jgi:hypothetical protein